MVEDPRLVAHQSYTLDELLIDVWQDGIRPILLSKSMGSRAVKASIGALIGMVTGLVIDGLVKFVIGKETKMGTTLGGMSGGAAGWFAPELSEMDWSQVMGALNRDE